MENESSIPGINSIAFVNHYEPLAVNLTNPYSCHTIRTHNFH